MFDLDGVVFQSPSTWERIFADLGLQDLHDRLEGRFQRGEFRSYLDWSTAALEEIKAAGLKKDAFDAIINERQLSKGAKETFEALGKWGIKTAAISGGFVELAERARMELGIDYAFAHVRMGFGKRSNMLESWNMYETDYSDKLVVARFVSKLYSADMSECAYVGDGLNDIPVFREVGMGIAFNSRKEEVRKAAHAVVDGDNLSDILLHLGLKRIKRGVSPDTEAMKDLGRRARHLGVKKARNKVS